VSWDSYLKFLRWAAAKLNCGGLVEGTGKCKVGGKRGKAIGFGRVGMKEWDWGITWKVW
jgi:hypothetical protein